jgi:hypothetical protein
MLFEAGAYPYTGYDSSSDRRKLAHDKVPLICDCGVSSVMLNTRERGYAAHAIYKRVCISPNATQHVS